MIQDKPVKAEQTYQLRQEVVLSELTLGVVCIERLEILFGEVLLGESLLDVVLFKDRIFDEVGVGEVVQDRVTEDLQLLVVGGNTMVLFEGFVSEGLEEEGFVLELILEDLFDGLETSN